MNTLGLHADMSWARASGSRKCAGPVDAQAQPMCKPSESAYALCAARRAGPRRGRTRHCTTTACPELLRVLGARALRCGFNAWRGGNGAGHRMLASSASFLHMASDVLNVSRSPQFFGPHAGLSTFLGTCLCGILTRPWRQPGHFLPTPKVVGFFRGLPV